MLSFTEFFNQYNGQANVGDTDLNIGQCVGLVEKWIDNLNLPHIWGNAIDLLNNADKTVFTIVLNSPTNAPSEGDIVVLGKPYGLVNGEYCGHTGIATANCNEKTLELFEQNDPSESTPHLHTYDYSSVIGWIHPNVLGTTSNSIAAPNLQQVEDELKRQTDATNSCLIQLKSATEQNKIIQQQNTDLTAEITDLQSKLKQANSNYENEQNRNISLNDALKIISAENQDKGTQLLDAGHTVSSLQSCLAAVASKIGIKTAGLSDSDITEKCLAALSGSDAVIANQNKQIASLQQRVKQSPPPQASVGDDRTGIIQKFISLFFRGG